MGGNGIMPLEKCAAPSPFRRARPFSPPFILRFALLVIFSCQSPFLSHNFFIYLSCLVTVRIRRRLARTPSVPATSARTAESARTRTVPVRSARSSLRRRSSWLMMTDSSKRILFLSRNAHCTYNTTPFDTIHITSLQQTRQ